MISSYIVLIKVELLITVQISNLEMYLKSTFLQVYSEHSMVLNVQLKNRYKQFP